MFPGFDFEVGGSKICSEPGYICWQVIKKMYDKDKKLFIKLRKTPKSSYQVLHPSDKQIVNLAMILIHKTSIPACRYYFP